ncbi:MAG: hypothetical protein IJJ15_10230 [Ruminococcus sp.]|nr:hypothetical protein [Ruminococcus sp.]
MEKTTDELLKSLKSKKNIEDFFKENTSELLFSSLKDLIDFYINRKKLKKSEVIRRSMLGSYAYNIINGDRKNPERDKLIMLCFGLELSYEEANELLKKNSNAELYTRNGRDAVFIFALDRKMSVIETNNMLDEYGFDLLPLPN